jgi:hypothetical protein
VGKLKASEGVGSRDRSGPALIGYDPLFLHGARSRTQHKRALASTVLAGGDQALTQLTDRELTDLVFLGKSAC